MTRCPSCGAPVTSAKTSGATALLNPSPIMGGRWILEAGIARFVGSDRGEYENHRLYCE